jgi:hypothetical protein
MPKVSFTREELELVHLCLNLDLGGGDMRGALEHLVAEGHVRPGKVDCNRILEKIEEAMP